MVAPYILVKPGGCIINTDAELIVSDNAHTHQHQPPRPVTTHTHTHKAAHSDLYRNGYTFRTLIKDCYREREFPYFVLLIPNIFNLLFHQLFIWLQVLPLPRHCRNRGILDPKRVVCDWQSILSHSSNYSQKHAYQSIVVVVLLLFAGHVAYLR